MANEIQIRIRKRVQAQRTICTLGVHGTAGSIDKTVADQSGNADAMLVRDFLREKGFEVAEITKKPSESFYDMVVIGERDHIVEILESRFRLNIIKG